MRKRERLEKTIVGAPPDRVPVALWRHWPGDDQRAADLAHATLEFQQTFDWDFINMTPASTYGVVDYGVQAACDYTAPSGDCVAVKRLVSKSLQWTELRDLDPHRGELGKHLEAVRLVCDKAEQVFFGDAVPIIMTIHSPLTQASMIGEPAMALRHMRTHPDRLRTGLNTITGSILNFLDALKRTSIDGIFYVIDHADFSLMSEAEYRQFGLPYDLKILETLSQKWWLNIVSLQNAAPMFSLVGNYPIQAINWDVHEARPDIDKAWSTTRSALCTGLHHQKHIQQGTPNSIRTVSRDILGQVYNRHFILAADAPVPVNTPVSNLRAVRQVVEGVGRV